MTLTSTGHPATEIIDLKTQISELENQYAELFLDDIDREQLKIIHQHLEILKQELAHKTPKGR